MKIDKEESRIRDIRVWCEHCSIRIAPHEEKTEVHGKTYHPRCYSKHSAARSAKVLEAGNVT
jgi:hypothetical protein